MVSVWELKDVIHQEEQKVIAKEVRQKSIRNAEMRREREALLSGPTDYIDLLRKAKVPITATDIKEAVNQKQRTKAWRKGKVSHPTKSKILDLIDWKERLVATHALGYRHGMYLRIGIFSILFAVLMWL